MTPERLRKGGGKLRMPLGQRIAHMRPEGRIRPFQPLDQPSSLTHYQPDSELLCAEPRDALA
jgi:hypothetical protein